MRKSSEMMQRNGISHFIDFREGGVEGVNELREAIDNLDIEPIIMGRGDSEVLEVADGYGASGARDSDFTEQRRKAENLEKPFGIHAGERDSEDIEPAFRYNPDFMVHMVHSKNKHHEKLREKQIPIVVCPRSNLVTDVGLPPLEELLENTTVALGTDNVMMNTPSMWREMEFTSKLFDVSDRDVLKMATVNAAKLIDKPMHGVIKEDTPANIQVLHGDRSLEDSRDLIAGIVRRAGAFDIKKVIINT